MLKSVAIVFKNVLTSGIDGCKMNERIKELAEESGMTQYVAANNKYLERFAELIIKECMRMCDVAAVGYEEHGDIKEANGCVLAMKYIAEHLGVES